MTAFAANSYDQESGWSLHQAVLLEHSGKTHAARQPAKLAALVDATTPAEKKPRKRKAA
jgi:hypothetical protein